MSIADDHASKTGITLKDTGVRDEHGLEPVSGIFSSPASPPKQQHGTSSSNAMELQESSAPDVDETLHLRKTPRLPPPRASTPRHTNIGSPKRMSSARPQSRNADPLMASEMSPNRSSSHPPANRVLDFGRQNVRKSIESGSPFKPKKVLRRSVGGAQKDVPAETSASSPGMNGKPELPNEEEDGEDEMVDRTNAVELEAETGAGEESEDDRSEAQQQLDNQLSDNAPMFYDDDDYYNAQPDTNEADITEAFSHAEELLKTTPVAKSAMKAKGRPRQSGGSVNTSLEQKNPQTAQTTASSRKRDRTVVEEQEEDADQTHQSIEQTDVDNSNASLASDRSAKRRKGRQSDVNASTLQVQTQHTIDEADQTHQSIEQGGNEDSQISATAQQPAKRRPGRPRKSDITVLHDQTEQTIDPAMISHGDSYLAPVDEEGEVEIAPAPPITKKKPGRKPKAQKAAPKERDPNQSIRRTTPGTPKANSRERSHSPTKRATSVSNVNLRATTPFEDSHQQMSRSGRPILKPLKHWAGESYVWKNGEVEGIIRADEVKAPREGKKKSKGRRRAPRAGKGRNANDLDDIAEESDTESTVPDDWEEQVGVIAGTVASWDPDRQQGDPRDPVREGMFTTWSVICTEC